MKSFNDAMRRMIMRRKIWQEQEKISNPWLSLPQGWKIIPVDLYFHIFDENENYQGTIDKFNPKAGLQLMELLELV